MDLYELGITPLIIAYGTQGSLSATADELLFLDGELQRIRLKDISKVQTAGGILRVFTGEQLLLSGSLQGYKAEDLKQFFSGLTPLVQSAKTVPEPSPVATAATAPTLTPTSVTAPTSTPSTIEPVLPEPLPSKPTMLPEYKGLSPKTSKIEDLKRFVVSLRVLSLLMVILGITFAILNYVKNPENLVYTFWIFISGATAALLMFVFAEILKTLMEVLSELR